MSNSLVTHGAAARPLLEPAGVGVGAAPEGGRGARRKVQWRKVFASWRGLRANRGSEEQVGNNRKHKKPLWHIDFFKIYPRGK